MLCYGLIVKMNENIQFFPGVYGDNITDNTAGHGPFVNNISNDFLESLYGNVIETSSEKPTTTEDPTTEDPTTEKPSTKEPSTEEPTTEMTTTEEKTTKEPPFIEITTTQRVEEPTAEAPTTGDLTTVITTTESLMKDETTEKASTATQNPKILTTEEQKTAETTTNKPVDWSTDKMKTEETTSETKIYSFSTVDPSAIIRLAPGKFSDNTLPDGRKISDLGNDFKIYSGINDWSRIVANNKAVYVLHPVQRNDGKTMFDPYTIGQVLGYIYEKRNLDKINHLEANIQSN
uniref:SH3b domain-containing protein n=1 Tax=Caenorhabditis tropicalis TaxID=1561998 RepID=A0A1I7V073_9PELO